MDQGQETKTTTTGILATLATLPTSAMLTETALADALGVNKRTIRRMVQRGELPPGVPFAGRKTWLAGKVLSHFELRAERAAREAERHQQKLQTSNLI